MSTVAIATKKFQLGTAAFAVAAAATLTPVAAQAAPSFAPFVDGLGNSASSVVSSVVVNNAAVVTDPCTGASFKLACYTVEGAVAGTYALVRGVVIYVGTVAYVLVEGTGEFLKFVGDVLPAPIGPIFTSLGNGVSSLATTIAQLTRTGPYLGT